MPVHVSCKSDKKTTEKRWRHRFPYYKSMGAFCCHGNQSSDPICPKTSSNLSPTLMILHIKFDQHWPTGLRDFKFYLNYDRKTEPQNAGWTREIQYSPYFFKACNAKYQNASTKALVQVDFPVYALVQVDFSVYALSTHKQNPYLNANRKKMAKFTKLSFCQKIDFWHKTSSCKCSMGLYCVCKASNCFIKSCGTSSIPRICTIYAHVIQNGLFDKQPFC